jgi:hypothetical protein
MIDKIPQNQQDVFSRFFYSGCACRFVATSAFTYHVLDASTIGIYHEYSSHHCANHATSPYAHHVLDA